MNYSKFLLQLKEEFKGDDSVNSKIAEFILNNINEISDKSLDDIASAAFTTTPSVVKFLKKFGFVGLKDFKVSLAYEVAQYKKVHFSETNDSYLNLIESNFEVLKTNLNKIQWLADDINNKESIYLFGYGKNGLILDYFVDNTFWTGKFFNHFKSKEVEFVHKLRRENAIFILISFTGQTPEIVDLAKILSEDKSEFWVITSNPKHGLLPESMKNNEIILGANESSIPDSWSFEISLLTLLNMLSKKLTCKL